MGREQGPRVHGEGRRLDQFPHADAEIAPIGVVPEEGAALESSHHHVVEDPGSIEARLPGHDQHKRPQSHFRSNVPYRSEFSCDHEKLLARQHSRMHHPSE